MGLKKGVTRKTRALVRRNLKRELAHYLDRAPDVPPLADYYEAALKEGFSQRRREDAYRKVLPELSSLFDELMRDWGDRLSREPPDLSVRRDNAVKAGV
jgi:hypothetical protein